MVIPLIFLREMYAEINNQRLVDTFNDWVADLDLIELPRVVARFTLCNNQDESIRCVLDHVSISTDWEAKFSKCSLVAETILGSDQ